MKMTKQRIVSITRVEHFSAAHRLHSIHLNEQENATIFGKCNHKNGHGHNYKVEVTITGPVDPKTGMVMNLSDLKKIMKDKVIENLDHKHLDHDVLFFKENPSTAENIAIFIYEQLVTSLLSSAFKLHVKVFETENNIAIYDGSYL